MGFIKRFLSLKRFKSLKGRIRRSHSTQGYEYKSATPIPISTSLEQDQEAAAARLLRSSSTHFSVVSEVDYASLPPIPHPINTIVKSPTISPTKSLSTRTKNSYTVTIHGRTHHKHTEFPNANPSFLDVPSTKISSHDASNSSTISHSCDPIKVPITPKDKNRLSRLRQDPSVASLLSMYDDHGRLDDHAFSNTPIKPSRLQSDGNSQKAKRSSTLRELLGSTDGEDGLGDISWADGHLAVCDRSATSISSTSSLGLETPTDALFNTDAFVAVASSPKITDQLADISTVDSDMTAQYPMISSMEVELSTATDEDDVAYCEDTHANQSIIRTPSKRASQIFGFLSERRKRAISEPREGSLQPVSLSLEGKIPALDVQASQIKNADDSFISFSDTGLNLPPPPLFFHDSSMFSVPTPPSPAVFQPLPPPPRPKARSTSAVEVLKAEAQPILERKEVRALRGPRPLPSPANFIQSKWKSTDHALDESTNLNREKSRKAELPRMKVNTEESRRDAFPEDDRYTQIPSRIAQRRLDASSGREKEQQKIPLGRKSGRQETGALLLNIDKENTRYTSLSERRPVDLSSTKTSFKSTFEPSTPTKTSPLSLLHPNTYQLPSPASSTELSPEAKQLMTKIRMQRMGVREREKHKLGSLNGRILRA